MWSLLRPEWQDWVAILCRVNEIIAQKKVRRDTASGLCGKRQSGSHHSSAPETSHCRVCAQDTQDISKIWLKSHSQVLALHAWHTSLQWPTHALCQALHGLLNLITVTLSRSLSVPQSPLLPQQRSFHERSPTSAHDSLEFCVPPQISAQALPLVALLNTSSRRGYLSFLIDVFFFQLL